MAIRTSHLPLQTHSLTDLLFDVGCLIWGRSGQNARVCEAGLQEGDHHKDEEHSPNHRNEAGQVLHQEGTAGMRKDADVKSTREGTVAHSMTAMVFRAY